MADLTNGIIYTLEGDGINATLSFAATIPIAGWAATGAKIAKRSIVALNGSKRILYLKKTINGVIDFGDRGLLRDVLGLATGDARQAHHLIPWEKGPSLLVQKASAAGFHLNEIVNGIPLTKIQHNGSHRIYSDLIENKLNALWIQYGGTNMTALTADGVVRNLANQIKTWIVAHPNESINNIILP